MRYLVLRAVLAGLSLCLVGELVQVFGGENSENTVVGENASGEDDASVADSSAELGRLRTADFVHPGITQCDSAECSSSNRPLGSANDFDLGTKAAFSSDDRFLATNCVVSNEAQCPYDPIQASTAVTLLLSLFGAEVGHADDADVGKK
jgi:hypothetical protein